MNGDEPASGAGETSNRPTLKDIASWPAVVPVKQAASAFGISRSTAYELIQSGDFPAKVVRLGGRYTVLTASILNVLSDSGSGRDGA